MFYSIHDNVCSKFYQSEKTILVSTFVFLTYVVAIFHQVANTSIHLKHHKANLECSCFFAG